MSPIYNYYLTYNGGIGGNWFSHLVNKHKNFCNNSKFRYVSNNSYALGIHTISILEDILTDCPSHNIKNINELRSSLQRNKLKLLPPTTKYIFRGGRSKHTLGVFIQHIHDISKLVAKRIGPVRYIHLTTSIDNYIFLKRRVIHLVNIGHMPRSHNPFKNLNNAVDISKSHNLDTHGVDNIELINGSINEYKRLCDIIEEEPDFNMFMHESTLYRRLVWKDFM